MTDLPEFPDFVVDVASLPNAGETPDVTLALYNQLEGSDLPFRVENLTVDQREKILQRLGSKFIGVNEATARVIEELVAFRLLSSQKENIETALTPVEERKEQHVQRIRNLNKDTVINTTGTVLGGIAGYLLLHSAELALSTGIITAISIYATRYFRMRKMINNPPTVTEEEQSNIDAQTARFQKLLLQIQRGEIKVDIYPMV